MTAIEILIVFSKRYDFIVIAHGGAPPSNPVLGGENAQQVRVKKPVSFRGTRLGLKNLDPVT
jgi:hypothetical protein